MALPTGRRRLAAIARLLATAAAAIALFTLLRDPARPRRSLLQGQGRVALGAELLASTTASRSPEPPRPDAVFVMADNRALDNNYKDASLLTLSAVLNYVYTKRHGYGFELYRLPPHDRAQCEHTVLHEERGASWCKLLAAWRVASSTRARRVVLLDSDCAVVGQGTRLEDWLAGNLTRMGHHGPPPIDADLVLLSDHCA